MRYNVSMRAGKATGSVGKARQGSHKWRTSGPVSPVKVRFVKRTVTA